MLHNPMLNSTPHGSYSNCFVHLVVDISTYVDVDVDVDINIGFYYTCYEFKDGHDKSTMQEYVQMPKQASFHFVIRCMFRRFYDSFH